MRPVIEVPGRILTRINPHKVETTMIMHIRPGWEDLRNFIRGSPGDNGGCVSFTTPRCAQACTSGVASESRRRHALCRYCTSPVFSQAPPHP